jgi:hypothetical protein
MKEDNGYQGVGATEFDLANSQHPGYVNKIHYGNQRVPHPCNYKAERVDHTKVMSQTLRAK